jgi:hypothetical protein
MPVGHAVSFAQPGVTSDASGATRNMHSTEANR